MNDLAAEVVRVLAERRAALDEQEREAEAKCEERHDDGCPAWLKSPPYCECRYKTFNAAARLNRRTSASALASVVERRALYDAIAAIFERHQPDLSGMRGQLTQDHWHCLGCSNDVSFRYWQHCPEVEDVCTALGLGLGSTGEQGNENG